MRAPHSGQNFFPGGTAAPHDGHSLLSFPPQLEQNFFPFSLTAPQAGHFTCPASILAKDTLRLTERPPDMMNFSMQAKISSGNLL